MARPSEHSALPLAQWPAADHRAWDAAVRPAGFLEDAGKGAEWRPASKRSAQGAYGRWLAWLVSTRVGLDGQAPAARITPDRMRAYVGWLGTTRSSVTLASYLGVLCMTIQAMFPEESWRWLQALQRRFHRRASPSRNKEARLVSGQDLYLLGVTLMDAAIPSLDSPNATPEGRRRVVAAARDYRDGLIIALLSLRPLRAKNLLQIDIGRHLRKGPSGHVLAFISAEMKDKRAFHQSWPISLEEHLSCYLTRVRPTLITSTTRGAPARTNRPAGTKLWIAQGGTPMSAGALQKALKRHTVPRFGHSINAHLFRDCAATSMANQDPNNVRYAAKVLGHAGLHTTERSYIAADSRDSLDRHHDLISAIRQSGRKPRRTH